MRHSIKQITQSLQKINSIEGREVDKKGWTDVDERDERHE